MSLLTHLFLHSLSWMNNCLINYLVVLDTELDILVMCHASSHPLENICKCTVWPRSPVQLVQPVHSWYIKMDKSSWTYSIAGQHLFFSILLEVYDDNTFSISPLRTTFFSIPFLNMSKTKSSILNIFQTFLQKWISRTPFILSWYSTIHMCKNYFTRVRKIFFLT